MTKVEQVIEQIEEEHVDMENIVKEKTSNESKNSATIQRKQKVKTLADVPNDNNYDNAPPQDERSFEYTDFKKKVKLEWKTKKDEQIHKRGAENVYKNKPGPRSAAKSVKNPSSLFKLFFMDKMMDNTVQYTSQNMQPVIEKFSDPLDGSTKYSHVKLVDRFDIQAFIDILYLAAALRLNILDREFI